MAVPGRRPKARLIVRGFQDPDAWEGTVPTSSPTTTRLSRSMLLSLASTMSWPIWTSDNQNAVVEALLWSNSSKSLVSGRRGQVEIHGIEATSPRSLLFPHV